MVRKWLSGERKSWRGSQPFHCLSGLCIWGQVPSLPGLSLMKGGDLRLHIYSTGTRGLATSRVAFCSAQRPRGLLHLHSLSIVYQGLKPENVLLDHLGNRRLGDLGDSRLSNLGLAVQVQEGKPVTRG